MMKGISFNAILNRIATTVDGGWRISIDVPQTDADAIKRLSDYRMMDFQVVILTAAEIANFEEQKHDSE